MNQPPPGFAPHHHHAPPPHPLLHLPHPIPPIPQNGYINGNGNGNGNDNSNNNNSSNGSATPPTASSNTSPQTPTPSEFDLASYVYNAGFIHAAWADTFLSISPHPPLRLHALFASRSPLIYNILANYPGNSPPYHINLPSEDKYLTSNGLSLAAATLYGHSLDIQSCDLELAKGLLSAGNLLGLDDVSSAGYQAVLNLLNIDNVEEILKFALQSASAKEELTSGRASPDVTTSTTTSASASATTTSPTTPATTPTPSSPAGTGSGTPYEDLQITYPGPYPRFTSKLVSIIVDFVLANVKDTKQINQNIKSILLTLPFHIYKHIIENDKLAVKSHMERHSFAREMTNLREQYRKKNNSVRPVIYEENVVLAFGGGKGGVEVIRKPIGKKKTLWKASQ